MKTREASSSRAADVLTFQDLTDFRGENDEESMNGWVKEAGATDAVVIHLQPEDEDFLYGANFTRYEGPLISKTITQLVPGESYQVSFRGKKSENIPGNAASIPWIAVHVDGKEAIAPQRLAYPHLWASYSGRFSATSTSAKVEFISVMKNPNGADVPTQGFRNYHLDDIAITGRFDDLTDFNDNTYGAWQRTENSPRDQFVDATGRGRVLKFPTYGNGGENEERNDGDILTRNLDELVSGSTYTFSVEVRRDIGAHAVPILSLVLNGDDLGATFSPTTNVWTTLTRTFVATPQTRLAIRSHVRTGLGNDYSLDNIRITEVGDPS